MTAYIVLAFFIIVSLLICAIGLGSWGADVPRWGDE
jgi:hypothetical protein